MILLKTLKIWNNIYYGNLYENSQKKLGNGSFAEVFIIKRNSDKKE